MRLMIPLITVGCAVAAFVLALMHGLGRSGKPPLWIAVALLAFGVALPWILSRVLF